jgi:hypothetical protein
MLVENGAETNRFYLSITADRGEYKNGTYLFAILLHILNT